MFRIFAISLFALAVVSTVSALVIPRNYSKDKDLLEVRPSFISFESSFRTFLAGLQCIPLAVSPPRLRESTWHPILSKVLPPSLGTSFTAIKPLFPAHIQFRKVRRTTPFLNPASRPPLWMRTATMMATLMSLLSFLVAPKSLHLHLPPRIRPPSPTTTQIPVLQLSLLLLPLLATRTPLLTFTSKLRSILLLPQPRSRHRRRLPPLPLLKVKSSLACMCSRLCSPQSLIIFY
jgi:hypothetical protein